MDTKELAIYTDAQLMLLHREGHHVHRARIILRRRMASQLERPMSNEGSLR